MGAPGPGLVHTDTKAFMSCGHAKKEVRVGRGRTGGTVPCRGERGSGTELCVCLVPVGNSEYAKLVESMGIDTVALPLRCSNHGGRVLLVNELG